MKIEERQEIKCKFGTWDSCAIQTVFERQPTELECIACSLRQIALEIHAEDGMYQVRLVGEED